MINNKVLIITSFKSHLLPEDGHHLLKNRILKRKRIDPVKIPFTFFTIHKHQAQRMIQDFSIINRISDRIDKIMDRYYGNP